MCGVVNKIGDKKNETLVVSGNQSKILEMEVTRYE